MKRPSATFHDALTGTTEVREMTDEEYEALLATGWTEEGPVEEEQP
jgi:hypothetical protein